MSKKSKFPKEWVARLEQIQKEVDATWCDYSGDYASPYVKVRFNKKTYYADPKSLGLGVKGFTVLAEEPSGERHYWQISNTVVWKNYVKDGAFDLNAMLENYLGKKLRWKDTSGYGRINGRTKSGYKVFILDGRESE